MRALLLALLLTAPVLTGCLGGQETDTDEPVTKARASVTERLGGIEGVVTDEAVQPVVGANVTISELDRSVQTEEDGSFAFSELQPATYTVSVNASQFVSRSQEIDVRASDVAIADFTLTRLFTQEPFTQEWEFAGFFECGLAVGGNLSAVGQGAFGLSTRPCRDAGSVFQNSTNDRSDHRWTLEPPVETLVFESQWDSSNGQFSDRFWIDVVIDGFHCPNYCNWTILDMNGPSPQQATIGVDRFENVSESFHQACEEGEDEFCGYNFWDTGWPLWSRVYPRWECQPTPLQACAPLQQEYRHYVTAFYNAPAPDGYSLIE